METRSLASFTSNVLKGLDDGIKNPFMVDVPGKESVVVAPKSFYDKLQEQYLSMKEELQKIKNHKL